MNSMLVLGWVVIGGIAGIVANYIMNEQERTAGAVVGIFGSMVGGMAFIALSDKAAEWSLVVAFIGAVTAYGLFVMFAGSERRYRAMKRKHDEHFARVERQLRIGGENNVQVAPPGLDGSEQLQIGGKNNKQIIK